MRYTWNKSDRMLMRFAAAVIALLLAAPSFAQSPQRDNVRPPDPVPASFAQPPPQTEFIPMDKLPPSDQLPSAPLLIAAYAFVWIAVMFYLWTIWRRLNRVEAEMRSLEQKTAATRR
jgi:CcmD family protein